MLGELIGFVPPADTAARLGAVAAPEAAMVLGLLRAPDSHDRGRHCRPHLDRIVANEVDAERQSILP